MCCGDGLMYSGTFDCFNVRRDTTTAARRWRATWHPSLPRTCVGMTSGMGRHFGLPTVASVCNCVQRAPQLGTVVSNLDLDGLAAIRRVEYRTLCIATSGALSPWATGTGDGAVALCPQ